MKIVIFYHACLVNDFKFVVQDQLSKLFISGLYDQCDSIFIGAVYYQKEDFEWLINLFIKYKKIQIVGFENGRLEEKHTLKLLSNFCTSEDAFVFYFHSKGVYNRSYHSNLWRMIMDYHSIFQWKTCIEKIKSGYDTAGILYRKGCKLYLPHYSGGYWWTTSSHIKTLNHQFIYADSGKDLGLLISDYIKNIPERHWAEFWIGSNSRSKHCCLYPFNGVEPYQFEYKISDYLFP